MGVTMSRQPSALGVQEANSLGMPHPVDFVCAALEVR